MKKVLKRSLISIVMVYVVISMVCNFYSLLQTKQWIANKKFSNQMQEVKISIPENMTMGDMIQIDKKISIYEENVMQIKLFVISSFMGILIGLVLSLKENAKIKLILIFIVGNVVLTNFLTTVVYFKYYNNGLTQSYFHIYMENTMKLFIPYTICCIMIYLVYLLDSKRLTENMNKNLKK